MTLDYNSCPPGFSDLHTTSFLQDVQIQSLLFVFSKLPFSKVSNEFDLVVQNTFSQSKEAMVDGKAIKK